jgi:hypothetical protein
MRFDAASQHKNIMQAGVDETGALSESRFHLL